MSDTTAIVEQVAAALAAALDQCDFDTAATLLHAQCEYVIDAFETHVGPDAIITSYRGAHDAATAVLDSVTYESSVRGEGTHAVIAYVDHLAKGVHRHTHRCEQRIECDPDGHVIRITHQPIDGERDTLDAFFAAAEIDWPQ